MLVDVERIGLLRKVVCAHGAARLCRFVFWLTKSNDEKRCGKRGKDNERRGILGVRFVVLGARP
jgi:hypothetical protein